MPCQAVRPCHAVPSRARPRCVSSIIPCCGVPSCASRAVPCRAVPSRALRAAPARSGRCRGSPRGGAGRWRRRWRRSGGGSSPTAALPAPGPAGRGLVRGAGPSSAAPSGLFDVSVGRGRASSRRGAAAGRSAARPARPGPRSPGPPLSPAQMSGAPAGPAEDPAEPRSRGRSVAGRPPPTPAPGQPLPIRVLKMLSPLSSTPVSPIEVSARRPRPRLGPYPRSRFSELGSSQPGAPGSLSWALPSPALPPRKEGGADKAGFRVPSAACPPFPRTPPLARRLPRGSPQHPSPKAPRRRRSRGGKPSPEGTGGALGRGRWSPAPALPPAGHVAPVSPYKPGHSVFPLPPSSIGYHGSIVGAYAGYPSQFVPGLDPTKPGLVSSQLPGALGLPGKPPSSSPLTGASPPSFMQGLCRDPYCLSYHSASHLGSSNCSSCVHDPGSLKSGYPLVYPTHPLHSVHTTLSSSGTASLPGHPLYTYGFMLQNDPLPHICNWVSASGPCDKRFATSEELLTHLRTHTALPGAEKLLAGYPTSGLGSAASCHLHLPPAAPGSPSTLPASLSLRSPHTLGLNRYHPYGKSHLPTAGALPVPSLPAAGPYYSPYALYGQRLTSASALGYQ
uniref:C2H2-type domain-containing protein n=16 Tax=Neognathae TaxID=8825 RepID=A0A8C5UAF0_9PASS